MSNATLNLCPAPFFDERLFPAEGGFVDGRLCQQITKDLQCCLPCPMADWVYPDRFASLTAGANWVAAVSTICCAFLLLSWAALPAEKTNRHYLSICFTIGVCMMNFGFIIPLAAQPEQCYNEITPNSMHTSSVCGASGAFLILGGWAGVMWAFLRTLSIHLQVCWQIVVGRNFMIFAMGAGWGIPIMGLVFSLVFSGVSFRFNSTCHINHENSLQTLWIPLLIFAGMTIIITVATFAYCIKVYLQSLGDNDASTENSNLPTYNHSVTTFTPRQAYRRVKRVILLQYRAILITTIVAVDVIYFSVIFVFQDNVIQSVTSDPKVGEEWVRCLIGAAGVKTECLKEAKKLVLNEATVTSVLLMLALNGVWLLFLLGRWTMVTGWVELIMSPFSNGKKEFVSVDARHEHPKDTRSYEMLSKETSAAVTPVSPVKSPIGGRRTPDYFGQTARYQPPQRSFSSPRPPPQQDSWDPQESYAPSNAYDMRDVNPLAMNKL